MAIASCDHKHRMKNIACASDLQTRTPISLISATTSLNNALGSLKAFQLACLRCAFVTHRLVFTWVLYRHFAALDSCKTARVQLLLILEVYNSRLDQAYDHLLHYILPLGLSSNVIYVLRLLSYRLSHGADVTAAIYRKWIPGCLVQFRSRGFAIAWKTVSHTINTILNPIRLMFMFCCT